MTQRESRYRGLIITDLDGTLLDSHGRISEMDRQTLERLGEEGYCRVAATGRNLYTAHRVMEAAFPIEYLVFSSGAGTVDWQSGKLLRSLLLSAKEVRVACAVFEALALDYFVHDAIPDNHHLRYRLRDKGNADFCRRLGFYRDTARELNLAERAQQATQLLSITDRGPELVRTVAQQLPQLKVIRATSPLDKQSLWIEVFAAGVSKANGCQLLREELGLQDTAVFAIGNDYNDLDLLNWADHAFVVAGAPEELRDSFSTVADCGLGFTEAIQSWQAGEI